MKNRHSAAAVNTSQAQEKHQPTPGQPAVPLVTDQMASPCRTAAGTGHRHLALCLLLSETICEATISTSSFLSLPHPFCPHRNTVGLECHSTR